MRRECPIDVANLVDCEAAGLKKLVICGVEGGRKGVMPLMFHE